MKNRARKYLLIVALAVPIVIGNIIINTQDKTFNTPSQQVLLHVAISDVLPINRGVVFVGTIELINNRPEKLIVGKNSFNSYFPVRIVGNKDRKLHETTLGSAEGLAQSIGLGPDQLPCFKVHEVGPFEHKISEFRLPIMDLTIKENDSFDFNCLFEMPNGSGTISSRQVIHVSRFIDPISWIKKAIP